MNELTREATRMVKKSERKGKKFVPRHAPKKVKKLNIRGLL